MSGLATLPDLGHEECLMSSSPLSVSVARPDCKGPQAAAAAQPEVLLSNHLMLPCLDLPRCVLSGHTCVKLTALLDSRQSFPMTFVCTPSRVLHAVGVLAVLQLLL